jgi:hypothetical protein
MKTINRLLLSIALITFCSVAAHAQRAVGAESLILDDGAGHTSTLVAPAGGSGTITLPSVSGTLSVGGFTPSFFNAYMTFGFVVAPGEIPIIQNGVLAVNAGFINDGVGAFTVTATGVYNVEFTIAPTSPGTFAIEVNGTIAPNSQFGCETGTTIVHGNAMISLTAGDAITLVNVGPGTNLLSSVSPGTVTASLTATRIQ